MGRHQRSSAVEPSQFERAYAGIKARIVDGSYRHGSPLSENMLARLHGTSRTPVREALARLVQEGFVERVAGRGYFVARITVQLIRDTFDIRRLLEGAAAARAAEVASDDELARLEKLAEFRFAVGDLVSYRKAEAANAEFHLAVAGASHNRLAADLIRDCLRQMDRFMSLGVDIEPFQGQAGREHHAIVDAIRRRDPAAARETMEAHLDRSSRLMQDALLHGDLEGV
jgi:DNA-binding GntR family transcriptional regulator